MPHAPVDADVAVADVADAAVEASAGGSAMPDDPHAMLVARGEARFAAEDEAGNEAEDGAIARLERHIRVQQTMLDEKDRAISNLRKLVEEKDKTAEVLANNVDVLQKIVKVYEGYAATIKEQHSLMADVLKTRARAPGGTIVL